MTVRAPSDEHERQGRETPTNEGTTTVSAKRLQPVKSTTLITCLSAQSGVLWFKCRGWTVTLSTPYCVAVLQRGPEPDHFTGETTGLEPPTRDHRRSHDRNKDAG